MASMQEAIIKLEKYLLNRGYKNIHVNYSKGEIVAERKNSFFRKRDQLFFLVKKLNQHASRIELTLNPGREKKTADEDHIESLLRNKILFNL